MVNQRYDGLDIEILAKRKVLYQQKRNEHPERWSKSVKKLAANRRCGVKSRAI